MLFVDPESSEGAWLSASVAQSISIIPAERLGSSVSALLTFIERPLESMEIGGLIRHCVHALSPGAPPARGMDPRVTKVLNEIRTSDELRITLEDAAAMAFLSPGRFAHLFKHRIRNSLWWQGSGDHPGA
jgi:AraC family transcriptional regulator